MYVSNQDAPKLVAFRFPSKLPQKRHPQDPHAHTHKFLIQQTKESARVQSGVHGLEEHATEKQGEKSARKRSTENGLAQLYLLRFCPGEQLKSNYGKPRVLNDAQLAFITRAMLFQYGISLK